MGDGEACRKLNLTVYSAADLRFADVEDEEHPNRMPFSGVLLVLNQPSTKPPHGSRGHKIYVPTEAVKKNLQGLIGQGVNYAPQGMDGHNPTHKVGVITNATIDGDKVKVKGIVYAKDFPQAAQAFKQPGLGMSMELANVVVRDEDEPVWHLEDFAFTGATILRKDAAAYYNTSLAASGVQCPAACSDSKGEGMAKEKKDEQKKEVKVAAAGDNKVDDLAAAIADAVKAGNEALVSEIQATNAKLDELQNFMTIQAAGKTAELDVEAGHEEHMDEEDGEDGEDGEDDEEMEAMEDLEEESTDEEPGEVNKTRGDENKGKKTSVTDPPKQGAKVGGNIAEGRLQSSGKRPFPKLKGSGLAVQAAAIQIQQLSAELRKVKSQLRITAASAQKMRNKYERMEAQVARYADQEERRSSALPVELLNLAAKSNVDLGAIAASGQKMSVEQFDAMVNGSGIDIDPTSRAAMKNQATQLGLLDEGRVNRPWNQ